jgi:homoserine kinase type II
MAVYTEVSDEELEAFVAQYDIGSVLACKGIAEGVENSNYLLQTERGSFILTLYERRVARRDLPFFLGLMEHLAARGIACPTPIRGRDGAALRDLCGRPSAIISFLAGMWPRRATARHCRLLGEAMARLHLAGASFAMRRPNDLSVAGWRPILDMVAARAGTVQDGLAEALEAELAIHEASWPDAETSGLPIGVIHADLFPDNVFFRGEALSGIIDFYFACTDFLTYDLAICLNAWCFERDLSFNVTHARALLAGYGAVRPLQPSELAALPLLARGSALRFCLTRLYDWLNTPEGALVKRKDPLEYYQRLRFHQQIRGPAAYGLDP